MEEKIEKKKQPEATADVALANGPPKVVRVSERDRHLFAMLAEARMLTTEHVRRLMTPGRAPKLFYRRLNKLSAADVNGGRPMLRFERWIRNDGMERVWLLAPDGADEATALLGETPEVRRTAFDQLTMQHHAGLTEVYVRLLELPLAAAMARAAGRRKRDLGDIHARAEHPAWRWKVMGTDVALPWKEYQQGAGVRDKVIRPDAVLELLAPKRRLFIEYETGSHSAVPVARDREGSTVAKLRRYDAYMNGFAEVNARRTWYQTHFADGFAPELVFVVPTEGRAATVAKAIASTRVLRLAARAVTVAQLIAELAPLVGHSPAAATADAPTGKVLVAAPPAPAASITATEARALDQFFATVRSDLKARQAHAQSQRTPPPPVPANYEAVKALVARLAGATGAQRP